MGRLKETVIPMPGVAIMRNTYYQPDALKNTLSWARGKLSGALTAWERSYLHAEIRRIEAALAQSEKIKN